MPQPTIKQLFGSGASISSTGNLTIPLASLSAAGLSDTDPIGVFAAIVVIGGSWIKENQDESVMATCETSTFGPVTRNGQARTQYNFSLSFYGEYSAPTFDPDDL